MQEKVSFSDKKWNRLFGILSIPEKINSSSLVVIICHGFTSSKERYTELEKELNSHKVATLRFDFMGHGESEGKFEEITVSTASENIEEAINFLKEKGFIKIGLFWSSFWGLASMVTTSKRGDLIGLALKSPVSDYIEVEQNRKTKENLEKWEKEGFTTHTNSKWEERKLNYTFYEDGEKQCAYNFAQLITTPTLIVHGEADEIVPILQSQKTIRLIPNGKLKTIPDANHNYSNETHWKEVIRLVTEFFVNLNT